MIECIWLNICCWFKQWICLFSKLLCIVIFCSIIHYYWKKLIYSAGFDFKKMIPSSAEFHSDMVRQYLLGRVSDQIQFYDSSAQTNKKIYNILKVLVLIIAGVIAIFPQIFKINSSLSFIPSIAGVLLIFLHNLLDLGKYQSKMTEYRKTCEKLKSLAIIFINEYTTSLKDKQRIFEEFTHDFESIIIEENDAWCEYISKNKDKHP